MKRLLLLACGLATAGIAFVASALPAFGSATGIVNATVTAATPCITVSPSAADFGTKEFSTPGNLVLASNMQIGFTNCSTTSEFVYVSGTDASSGGVLAAVWQLDLTPTNLGDGLHPCGGANAWGTNKYKIEMRGPRGQPAQYNNAPGMTTTAAALRDSAGPRSFAEGVHELETFLVMPCAGSAGAGLTMGFQITFIASFA